MAQAKRAHMTNKVEIEDLEWADRLSKALDQFRLVNSEATANQVLVFLYIGTHPGTGQRDLMKHVGITDSAVARISAVLSDRGSRGRPGLGLIEIGEVPGDYRRVAMRLTPNGRRLFNAIRVVMTR